jgi:molecular chaperone DnaJ
VRVAGKGEPGTGGQGPGDLYLVIRVKPHPLLERKDDDLHMEVPITVNEAMAGAVITIPTLEGQVKLKVPPNSQSGKILKLKAKGAPNLKTKQNGDLYIRLMVKIPETDDKIMLDAVKKLDGFYSSDVRGGIIL